MSALHCTHLILRRSEDSFSWNRNPEVAKPRLARETNSGKEDPLDHPLAVAQAARCQLEQAVEHQLPVVDLDPT